MKPTNTLLIAEDEVEIQELLVERLQSLGHPIAVAVDGQEMIERALRDPSITAVLSDIKMPQLTGLDALKELRKRGVETPVVFLTAYGDKRMVIEALRFGAMDFLEKPWNDQILVETVRQAMVLGAKQKELEWELELLAKKYEVHAADMDRFKAIQKPVLMMKLRNQVFFKKKAG